MIEDGYLTPDASAQLNELDSQVRTCLAPLRQAKQEADNASIFKRGKARACAQEVLGQAQAELVQIIPWWHGDITSEGANGMPETIRKQAQQIMRAEAMESLEGLKSELETQIIYTDAHEHIEALQRYERYKR